MTENAKKWMELVSRNKELQEKLMAMNNKTLEEAKKNVIALAGENGVTLSDEDFTPVPREELSDDELDDVAGGGGCGCPLAGGGGGKDARTGKAYKCGCFTVGSGGEPASAYCICPFIGGGTDNVIA